MDHPILHPLSREQSGRLKKLRQKKQKVERDKQFLLNQLLSNKISVPQYHADLKTIMEREQDITTELRELSRR